MTGDHLRGGEGHLRREKRLRNCRHRQPDRGTSPISRTADVTRMTREHLQGEKRHLQGKERLRNCRHDGGTSPGEGHLQEKALQQKDNIEVGSQRGNKFKLRSLNPFIPPPYWRPHVSQPHSKLRRRQHIWTGSRRRGGCGPRGRLQPQNPSTR